MASQANLKTVISADMSGFSATMRRAGAVANSTGKSIGRSMSGATSAVGGLAKGATLAGVALAGAAASAAMFKGVRGAAQIESLTVAFTTLVGSAELAEKTLESLRDLGAETPFEFTELATAGRSLIAFGETAENVTSTLRMVGDVSSGVSAPIGEIAEIFGKAKVAGTLFAEDINQLVGRGIPVLQEFGKQLGVDAGQVKKLASEGKVTFDMLETAFKSLTSEGGKFYKMMEAQSRTFDGRMSTLKDSINTALNEFSKPINVALLPHIEALSAKITEMTPQFIAIGEDIGKRMPEILSGIGEFANGAYKVWQIFQRVGETIGVVFGTFFSPEYWSGVSDLISGAMMKPFEKLKILIDSVLSGESLVNAIKAGSQAGEISDSVVARGMEKMKPFEDALAEIMRPLKDIGEIVPKAPTAKAGAAARAIQEPQAGIYDKELAEQRKRVAADAIKMASGVKWGGDGKSSGNRIDSLQKAMKTARAFGEAVRPSGRVFGEGARPSGRAFGEGMRPSNRVFGQAGEELGQDSVFARDRAKKSNWNRGPVSLQGATGGLGAVRKVGQQREDREAKRAVQEQKTANEHLKNIDANIKNAVTVS